MRYQAVLFDLDGTLLNTLEDIADAVNAVLEGYRIPPYPVECYKGFIGEGVWELLHRAIPVHLRTEEIMAPMLERLRKEYAEHFAEKTSFFEGIPALLDEIAELGMHMAVLSNKPHDLTVLSVERFLPHWPFCKVLGAGDRFPRKPDPTAALHIAESMGISPSACLFLGDSGIDMQTASSAGMTGVGVLWGFRTQEELRDQGATHLIAHPRELVPWIRSSTGMRI